MRKTALMINVNTLVQKKLKKGQTNTIDASSVVAY